MTEPMAVTRDASVDALMALARERTTVDVPCAAPFFGIGTNKAYELIQSGEWPTRVLRLGKKIRIPVADLAAVLGISLDHDRYPE